MKTLVPIDDLDDVARRPSTHRIKNIFRENSGTPVVRKGLAPGLKVGWHGIYESSIQVKNQGFVSGFGEFQLKIAHIGGSEMSQS